MQGNKTADGLPEPSLLLQTHPEMKKKAASDKFLGITGAHSMPESDLFLDHQDHSKPERKGEVNL